MPDNIPWERLGQLYTDYEPRFAEIVAGESEGKEKCLYFGISVSPETNGERAPDPAEYRVGGSAYGIAGLAVDQTETTGDENQMGDEEVTYEEFRELLPSTLRALTDMQMEITEILHGEGYELLVSLHAVSGIPIKINPTLYTNATAMSSSCCERNGRKYKRIRINGKPYCSNTRC